MKNGIKVATMSDLRVPVMEVLSVLLEILTSTYVQEHMVLAHTLWPYGPLIWMNFMLQDYIWNAHFSRSMFVSSWSSMLFKICSWSIFDLEKIFKVINSPGPNGCQWLWSITGGQNLKKALCRVRTSSQCLIWIQNETCIQINTNKPI